MLTTALAPAWTYLVRAHASPGQGLNSDLASPNPAVLGWNDWRVGRVIGGAGASTVTGIGEYASDGTIHPSVLDAGGNNSPGKLGDDTNSPVHEFGDDGCARPSRATDEDEDEEEEEEDVFFFGTRATAILCRRRGLGKGKGRAAVVDGVVVESTESVCRCWCGGRDGARHLRMTWSGTMTTAATAIMTSKSTRTKVRART